MKVKIITFSLVLFGLGVLFYSGSLVLAECFNGDGYIVCVSTVTPTVVPSATRTPLEPTQTPTRVQSSTPSPTTAYTATSRPTVIPTNTPRPTSTTIPINTSTRTPFYNTLTPNQTLTQHPIFQCATRVANNPQYNCDILFYSPTPEVWINPPTPTPEDENTAQAYIVLFGMNVRSSPSTTQNNIIASIRSGERIIVREFVTENNYTWGVIRFGIVDAYVALEYIPTGYKFVIED